ncbi:MAG TPA: heme-copper oxidase subunit III [Ktedonobacterales bacterium]|nr:heme-copper oxidase subunit III [Ktedonobacterales bacterium]
MSTVVSATEAREESFAHHRTLGWYGMIFFIASEAVFFANLIAGYLYLRVHAGQWPPPPYTHIAFERTIPIINTVILLSSSFPMHWAARSISRGNRKNLTRGLLLTALLGAIFLSGQAYEYTHAAFSPSSGAFGSTFFVLTGFHGAHVTAGVLFILVCGARAARGDFTKDRHFAVNAVEMYWHFVDVVWVILFSVLYLL